MDSDAGGEDDDFGDEIRSDDEEEVGNDDANEGGGTLHQVTNCLVRSCYSSCWGQMTLPLFLRPLHNGEGD